jgi:prepilin-type N-terminal cleavage/methylation domain-containing protein
MQVTKEEGLRKGFTLIELIVVIIIVGILASVGMAQYTKVVEKGRAGEARILLSSLRTAEVSYFMENDEYAAIADLNVSAPTSCTSTHYFQYGCDSGDGTCTATRCTGSGKTPQGATAYTKTLTIDGVLGGDTGY